MLSLSKTVLIMHFFFHLSSIKNFILYAFSISFQSVLLTLVKFNAQRAVVIVNKTYICFISSVFRLVDHASSDEIFCHVFQALSF